VHDFADLPPVSGADTDRLCPHCGLKTVILVYRRFTTLVLFCRSCEHVWTEHVPSA
jgi:uncharacterized protein (DUF983 family)